ncbi:hypothetical protein L332_00020 [Agrococcus pavilionensis RW1]|uniref:Uncharacterized protein n=1 Tax=Agrococcus pavilionensis RW1 TaxID=1330458 RepID=U1LLS7_9MICO|nr:hypothetical protein [Agrococcus pavilionensis]ERG62857.1 hypothetical protein L332_00020 [Agrococcus pavilionensis RW1]
MTPKDSDTENAVAQGIAGQVNYLEATRLAEFVSNLERILVSETEGLATVASREARALLELDLARISVQGIIETNRGGTIGLHGFIAEYAEAGVANAERAIEGIRPLTRVLADNGRADLSSWGTPVQMKFYANPQNEVLQSVHYRDMKMMFPKDHFEVFDRIMRGQTRVEFDGSALSAKKVDAIREFIEQESAARGEPYSSWMRPSKLAYAEVQRGAISETLEEKSADLRQRAEEQRQQIKDDSASKRASAAQQAAPSWGEAAKVAGTAVAVQGTLAFCAYVYRRHREGTRIWEFDRNDWREGGVQTSKGSLRGGLTGLAIYGLTQVCRMGAPAAAAVASGAIGLATAVANHRAGKLDDDEFTDVAFFNAIEATGAAVGAGLGQMIIPIPIVGAVVGSIAASMVLAQGKKFLNEAENAAIEARAAEIKEYVGGLEAELQAEYVRIIAAHDYYRDLQSRAFDVTANVELQLLGTVEFARSTGVAEEQILHSIEEADAYFLSAPGADTVRSTPEVEIPQ